MLQDAAGNGTVPDRDATLGSGQFPVFLLRQEWDSDEDETVVRDYLSWIAPAPLTLQPLDEAQRIRLEPQLPVQYLCVEHHWRLFPTRIDRDTLQVARAKNRLQRAL